MTGRVGQTGLRRETRLQHQGWLEVAVAVAVVLGGRCAFSRCGLASVCACTQSWLSHRRRCLTVGNRAWGVAKRKSGLSPQKDPSPRSCGEQRCRLRLSRNFLVRSCGKLAESRFRQRLLREQKKMGSSKRELGRPQGILPDRPHAFAQQLRHACRQTRSVSKPGIWEYIFALFFPFLMLAGLLLVSDICHSTVLELEADFQSGKMLLGLTHITRVLATLRLTILLSCS